MKRRYHEPNPENTVFVRAMRAALRRHTDAQTPAEKLASEREMADLMRRHLGAKRLLDACHVEHPTREGKLAAAGRDA